MVKVSLRVGLEVGLCLVVGLATAGETVTMNIMGRPVGQVVAEVARLTGLPLEADRTVADVPVFVKVDNMPVRTFLERLQKITGSDWHERGTSVVLSRGNRRIAERSRQKSETETLLKQRIKSRSESLAQQTDWSEKAIANRVLEVVAARDKHHRDTTTEYGYTPDNYPTAWELVLEEAINRVAVAGIPDAEPGSPIVFSTRPNTLQLQLPYQPESINRAIQLEREFHGRLVAAGIRFRSRGVGHATIVPPPLEPVDKLLVRVEDYGSSLYTITVFVVGEGGKCLRRLQAQFHLLKPSPPGKVPPPSGRATLSAHSVEFAKAHQAYLAKTTRRYEFSNQGVPLGGGVFDSCTSPELKQKLRLPTLYEPLGFVVSEVMEALADQTSQSLMAMVPDSLLITLSRWAHSGNVTFAQLWTTQTQVNFAKDREGWLIYPKSFAATDDARSDRTELELLLKEPLSLKALARYAATAPLQNVGTRLDNLWMDLLAQQARLLFAGHRDYLEICHFLPFAWHRLPVVRYVPLSALPVAIRSKAFKMFLNDNAAMQRSSIAQPLGLTEIAQMEPTERYVAGMEDQIGIAIGGRRQEALCGVEPGMPGVVMDARQVGQHLSAPVGTRNRSKFTEYMLAEIETLQIGILMNWNTPPTRSLRTATVKNPSQKYTLEQLPESIRQAVERGRRDVTGGHQR